MNCGCKLVATVHGNSVEDIRQKPILRKLVLERMFERYIVLDNCGNVGHVGGVFDSGGSSLYYEGIHSKPPCARRAGCTTTHESQAGALGIPECTPPNRRQDFHGKPPCARRAGCTTTHESQAGVFSIPEFMPPNRRRTFIVREWRL